MMYYTVYQIRNLINDKVYIGAHKTCDVNDDYMGSGTGIKRAIKKYGVENFQKTILFKLSSEQEMYDKEAELVTEDFINRSDNYNAKTGGRKAYIYSQETKDLISRRTKECQTVVFGRIRTEKTREKISNTLKGRKLSQEIRNKMSASKKGVPKSEETKRRMSKSRTGLKAKLANPCPYCEKIVSCATYSRWHGEKCKWKGGKA